MRFERNSEDRAETVDELMQDISNSASILNALADQEDRLASSEDGAELEEAATQERSAPPVELPSRKPAVERRGEAPAARLEAYAETPGAGAPKWSSDGEEI